MVQLVRRCGRAAIAVSLVVGVLGGAALRSSASTYTSQPFQTEGSVVATPMDNGGAAADAAGSFSLASRTRTVGPVDDAAASDGSVRVDPKPDTVYLAGTPSGQYRSATRAEVVQLGARIFVAGREIQTSSGSVLVANYVWNPPPATVGGGVPNPTPNLPRDAVVQRAFFVDATITETGVTLVGSYGWSSLDGFTLGTFTSYGTPHVAQIAAAHDDHLRIYYLPYTKYWGADGKASTQSAVVRYGQPVHVTGEYRWDGNDWRFFATNVFNPPPTAAAGGPLATTAELVQGSNGSYSGTSTANFDANASADIIATVTWTHESNGNWDFTGTYTAAKQNSANSISGTITGVVAPGTVPTVTASLTVNSATGAWSGWTGTGTLKGTATIVDPTAAPTTFGGNFNWTIGP